MMALVDRIRRLFSTPPPETLTDEAAAGKRTLDLTIKRAEETTVRVSRRSANDLRKAEQLVRSTDEVAKALRQVWGP